jgi:hypothetical protein
MDDKNEQIPSITYDKMSLYTMNPRTHIDPVANHHHDSGHQTAVHRLYIKSAGKMGTDELRHY